MGSKYGNKRTEVDGIVFASGREARRYGELLVLSRGGLISDLELQPKYLLQESFKDRNGKAVRAIHYIADFRYTQNGVTVVEDAKGYRSEAYKLKAKMFQYKYRDVEFREV